LTNPETIHKINLEYRNVDKPTDVLSFPMFEKDEVDEIRRKGSKIPEVLGDIIISIEQVKAQAEEYGHSFERELSYMAVHGFYHIIGYDHIKEEDKKIMRSKEEAVLRVIGQERE
jgi:probable rRNA maturation factor